jgi:hypothetical protein
MEFLVDNNINYGFKYYDFKILWHYDITAVLNYIFSKNRRILIEEWEFFIEWPWWNLCLAFPADKPLHLYTEQEEKDLLKLLKELWIKK